MLTFDPHLEPRLRALMSEQGDDLVAITAHARRWVCDPSGFTTSPICLFSPLGDALLEVSEVFASLAGAAERAWDDVRRDTDRTLASYLDVDGEVATGMTRLAGRLS